MDYSTKIQAIIMGNDTFKSSAATWDSDRGRLNTAKTVAQAIKNILPFKSVDYAMDYGCGTGLISLELLPVIKNLTGIDLSDAMLDIFRKKIKENNLKNVELVKINSELDELPYHPYDLIFSSMTIHHVEHHIELLEKFYNILNKKGVLVIADLQKEEGDFHSDNSGVHHFGFDPDEFKIILKKIGFHNISYEIIHTIKKETNNNQHKEFPVFLINAVK